jgi:hypothetical protein
MGFASLNPSYDLITQRGDDIAALFCLRRALHCHRPA